MAGDNVRAGRAYVEIGTDDSKLLKGLAAAMKRVNKFAKDAREIGSKMFAFGSGALGGLAVIAKLFDSEVFAPIVEAANSMKAQIGSILGDALKPYIDGIASAIEATTDWIARNPEMVGTIADLAVGFTAVGGALAIVGAALVALTSPVALVLGALAGIAGAVMAVTDVLGITETGFGELFNSIRIGGQGLGTWFGKFWTYLQEGWEMVTFGISSAWDILVTGAKNAGSLLYSALIWVPKKLLEAFRGMLDGINSILSAVGAAEIGTETIDSWIRGLEEKQSDLADARSDRSADMRDRLRAGAKSTNATVDELQRKREALDLADPNDGTSFRFDKDKAAEGISSIAASIRRNLLEALGDASAGGVPLPSDATNPATSAAASTAAAAAAGAAAATRTVESSRNANVLGTFNVATANRLGAGSSLEERQAKASEETAKNTRALLNKAERSDGLVFA